MNGKQRKSVDRPIEIGLMLHGIGTPPAHVGPVEAQYWTDRSRFEAILDIARTTANRVLLSFDDGNISDIDIVLPALQKRGLKAWFFVLADRIGLPSYLNEDDIVALRRAGMRIGTHGCRHISWRGLSAEDLRDEIETGTHRLEAILGERIDTAALPFGEGDLTVCRYLRRAGMTRVFSSFHGPTLKSDWLVRRECVRKDIAMAVIEHWLTKHYAVGDIIHSTLRAAKHVKQAALWRAT